MNLQLSYCGEMVRAHDPDRFLISMMMPADRREALWALFAFNYEIAKTREVVTETQLGLIRLQWWRDALEGLYERDEVLEHEGLKALAEAIKAHDLPRDLLDTLIYAREFDLEDVLPGNMEGLINYADFTTTPLLKLSMLILGDDPNMEAVQPVAVNIALVGLLRAVVFHARQRRCYLPEDLMKAHGQSVNQLYELKAAEGLSEVARAVAEQVVLDVKPQSSVLKVTQKLAVIYLKQLQSVGYDVFSPKLLQAPAFKVLRLLI